MDVKSYNVCRACMNNQKDCLEEDVDFTKMSEKIIEMFTFCTSIQIIKSDGLPLSMCQQCVNNMQNCYNFINVCKSTDETLKLCLGQDKEAEDEQEVLSTGDIKDETTESCGDFNDGNDTDDVELKYDCMKKKERKSVTELTERKITNDKNMLSFVCPVCDEVKHTKRSYNNHLRNQHSEYKKYVCDICQRGFSGYSCMVKHLSNHDKVFACDLCPKIYKHRGSLLNHKKAHKPDRPYKCDHCPKAFAFKCYLRNHTKLHNGYSDNLCQLCGAAFAQSGALRIHMRTHTGHKPYMCTLCPYRCTNKSSLDKHLNSHTNTKKDKCPVCQRAFNGRDSLARHFKVHTGERPYRCDRCSLSFASNSNRRRHMVIVHSVPMEAIPKLPPGKKKKFAVTTEGNTKDIS